MGLLGSSVTYQDFQYGHIPDRKFGGSHGSSFSEVLSYQTFNYQALPQNYSPEIPRLLGVKCDSIEKPTILPQTIFSSDHKYR
jgi:hypothetical protein